MSLNESQGLLQAKQASEKVKDDLKSQLEQAKKNNNEHEIYRLEFLLSRMYNTETHEVMRPRRQD